MARARRVMIEVCIAFVMMCAVAGVLHWSDTTDRNPGGWIVNTILQNVTAAPTAPSFLSIDFPGTASTAINQDNLRMAIAMAAGVPVSSVQLVSLEALAGGGTRVNFMIASPVDAAATLRNVEAQCPATLVPLGADCSTLTTTAAPSPTQADDDTSQTAGTVVGAVVGGLVFLAILGGAAYFLLKKPKPFESENQFDLVPTTTSLPPGGYNYPTQGGPYYGGGQQFYS